MRGLCVNIYNNCEHKKACQWITVAIILHNLIINIEGSESGQDFAQAHTHADEDQDTGHGVYLEDGVAMGDDEQLGEDKRMRLMAELLAYRQ